MTCAGGYAGRLERTTIDADEGRLTVFEHSSIADKLILELA
jgi:hypothetical protein